MNAVILTLISLVMVFIVARGRAVTLLELMRLAMWRLFSTPVAVEQAIYSRCELRSRQAHRLCPSCHNTRICASDTICRHCKLEISLGRTDLD